MYRNIDRDVGLLKYRINHNTLFVHTSMNLEKLDQYFTIYNDVIMTS